MGEARATAGPREPVRFLQTNDGPFAPDDVAPTVSQIETPASPPSSIGGSRTRGPQARLATLTTPGEEG